MTYTDQWDFSQYVANRDIKCVVISGLGLLHFCHDYKNKPQEACWLQKDEIPVQINTQTYSLKKNFPANSQNWGYENNYCLKSLSFHLVFCRSALS